MIEARKRLALEKKMRDDLDTYLSLKKKSPSSLFWMLISKKTLSHYPVYTAAEWPTGST